MARPAKRSWRRHSDEFRARVIALASQPGVSVAAVALANGLNANMLRRWVREAGASHGGPVTQTMREASVMPAFVQLPMAAPVAAVAAPAASLLAHPTPTVFVEIHRGDTSVYVSLPTDRHSAAWLREVLS